MFRQTLKTIARQVPAIDRIMKQRDELLREVQTLKLPRQKIADARQCSPTSTVWTLPQPARPAVELTEAKKTDLAAALKRTFFADWSDAYKQSDAFEPDVAHQVMGRYSHFSGFVVPWLARHVGDMSGHFVVEVGSGTGSSTAALAQHVREIATFEIHAASIAAAEARAEILGYRNAKNHQTYFDAAQGARLGPVDGVFLAAVLEHCTFAECIDLLRAAWEMLKPGGWLCVVDTPNRFAPVDDHTSFLPFFSMLPIEVRLAYAHRSPREEFARQFSDTNGDAPVRMVRWGNGISYHEFELALGPDVHEWAIADGWEPEIVAALGIAQHDLFIELLLKSFAPAVNRAFARRSFYFVLKKAYTASTTD